MKFNSDESDELHDLFFLAMRIADFNEFCPTESHVVELLFKMRYGDSGGACDECGSTCIKRAYGGRKIKCLTCGNTFSFLTNTIFQGVKKLRMWVAYIFMLHNGIALSSSRFHKLFGMSQSAALAMIKKLMKAAQESDPESGTELLSAEFLPIMARRTLETPARAHPASEQEIAERQWEEMCAASEKDQSNDGKHDATEGPAEDKAAYTGPEAVEHAHIERETETGVAHTQIPAAQVTAGSQRGNSLQKDTTVQQRTKWQKQSTQKDPQSIAASLGTNEDNLYTRLSDEPQSVETLADLSGIAINEVLAALSMLEIFYVATRVPGDCYIRTEPLTQTRGPTIKSKPALDETEKTAIESTTAFIRKNSQFISRKCLQFYLTLHGVQRDRDRWNFESIIRMCFAAAPVSYETILAYVSPYHVRVYVPQ